MIRLFFTGIVIPAVGAGLCVNRVLLSVMSVTISSSSDWVFTIDRNFGIEYFDNPRTGGGAIRSYLIDYSPEFLDGVGHRLIILTFWLSEVEGIISDGLRKMGILGTGFHATQILDVLKSVSGRLALKLINNPKDAKEIIGLALTRLCNCIGGGEARE